MPVKTRVASAAFPISSEAVAALEHHQRMGRRPPSSSHQAFRLLDRHENVLIAVKR
jgi:hypothetical protein